uniref:LijG n=1 Tax=Ascomycota sp. F53 TaxID=1168013 RepID=A0A140CZC3_9ASCO|nr:lijG [Ascomycota sp. F53]
MWDLAAIRLNRSQPCHVIFSEKFVDVESKDRLTVTNPGDEKVIADNVHVADQDDVDAAVDAATAAFKTGPWSKHTATQRADILNKIAELIGTKYLEELSEIESVSMGQPISVARAMNSYLPMTFKFAPALAAGNTFIFKASEKSPLGALVFGKIFKEAGVPSGVVNIINGAGETGALLASHMKISKISFTGSAFTGKKIQAMAASSNLKKCTLELGGKSPCIVFEDVDIENTLDVCSSQFLFNTTQVCIATSRTFVHESIADQFIEPIKQRFSGAKAAIGSPSAPTTGIGPVVDKKQSDRVMSFIEAGKDEAELAVGGGRHGDKGFFIEPTIFLNPKDDARIWREGVFGPVLSIRTFKTEEEAVKLANDTIFGLSSSLHTKNLSRALRVSRQIEAGTVAINQSHGFAPQTPFGGYKQSGTGREFGKAGILQYLQEKTILIKTPAK